MLKALTVMKNKLYCKFNVRFKSDVTIFQNYNTEIYVANENMIFQHFNPLDEKNSIFPPKIRLE